MKLVDHDSLVMKLPKPMRFLVAFIAIVLVMATNANLAYMMTQEVSSPIAPEVVASTQVDSDQDTDGPDAQAALCELKDVFCDGETIAEVTQSQVEPLTTTVKRPVTPQGAPIKIGASKEMQEMVDYAWNLSHDWDFILTVERESGFNPKARNVNRNGTVDSGLTQINHFWHPLIVRDPRFKEWKFQLEAGYKLYKGGTTFYGFYKRNEVKDRFIAMK